jgi:hypothetical protein
MWKKYCTARPATNDSIIRRMRIVRWINKATGTHSEYVTLTACPPQISLSKRASRLSLYVHCPSHLNKLYITVQDNQQILKGVVSFIILIKLPRHVSAANCHLQGLHVPR